ncbi:zf-LSD1 domain-containing protein [Citrus sinensis]|nr:zf-LSD1 domain-containing protein [Citrus sinensis]
MRMALCWLMQGCQPGDSLVNYAGDEVDGYDETLCPIDFETQGMIVDDEINAILVRPLPVCRRGRYIWEDHRPRSGTWKGASGGEAISFSSCDDNQTSADTSSLTDIELFNLMLYERALSNIPSIGAITYSFIQASELGHGTTYGRMLTSMRSTIYHLFLLIYLFFLCLQ